MEHNQNLSILRGFLKFKSNVQKIWGVLILLSVITLLEVTLGILRPGFLDHNHILGMKFINWIFIFLTLVKAYYIMWDFMHVRDEKKNLKMTIVIPLVFVIYYIAFIFLVEADYVFEVLRNGFLSWDF